jgi:hypothetical protein
MITSGASCLARTVSAMTLTRAMDSWMPGLWNLEPQQVIGAAHSISGECRRRAAQRNRSRGVVAVCLVVWPWPAGQAMVRENGLWPAGRTSVQLQVTAV